MMIKTYHQPEEAEPILRLFEKIASEEGWQPNGEIRGR
jgi:hypothetical protein